MSDKQLPAIKANLRSGGGLLPIYPTTFEDVVRLAKMALTSGMLKPSDSAALSSSIA